MEMRGRIEFIQGREILDSRGNPTVEAEIITCEGERVRASVPSGASTGKFEALELRDRDPERYNGKGVGNAVANVNGEISCILQNESVLNQNHIDRQMIFTDATQGKERLGANSILAVSMATAKAGAKVSGLPLYRYLGGANAHMLPVPMSNIINGGAHTDTNLDFQEFMIMPTGAKSFHDALRMCAEIYHVLKELLKKEGKNTAVGDEGGFAPDLNDAEEVFEVLTKAVQMAGYKTGSDIVFAMDAAASELYDEESGLYCFPGESRMKGQEIKRTTDEMIAYYKSLTQKYPLISIEDGLSEENWDGWVKLTKEIGDTVQLVGDDLFVTNVERLNKGIKLGAANAILIKVNQIGTVTEAMNAIEVAKCAGYRTVISHRSGETEDTFIADLAVAVNAGQIKTGAPCRSDRVAKYNRLLRIEEEIAETFVYRNPFTSCDLKEPNHKDN